MTDHPWECDYCGATTVGTFLVYEPASGKSQACATWSAANELAKYQASVWKGKPHWGED